MLDLAVVSKMSAVREPWLSQAFPSVAHRLSIRKDVTVTHGASLPFFTP